MLLSANRFMCGGAQQFRRLTSSRLVASSSLRSIRACASRRKPRDTGDSSSTETGTAYVSSSNNKSKASKQNANNESADAHDQPAPRRRSRRKLSSQSSSPAADDTASSVKEVSMLMRSAKSAALNDHLSQTAAAAVHAAVPASTVTASQQHKSGSSSTAIGNAAAEADAVAAAKAVPATFTVTDDISGGPSLCNVVPLPTDQCLAFTDAALILRDYQKEAIRQIITQWKDKQTGVQLVMLPTGCGKTVVFAALARYMSQHYVPSTDKAALSEAHMNNSGSAVASGIPAVATTTVGQHVDYEVELLPSCSIPTVAAAAASAGHQAPPGTEAVSPAPAGDKVQQQAEPSSAANAAAGPGSSLRSARFRSRMQQAAVAAEEPQSTQAAAADGSSFGVHSSGTGAAAGRKLNHAFGPDYRHPDSISSQSSNHSSITVDNNRQPNKNSSSGSSSSHDTPVSSSVVDNNEISLGGAAKGRRRQPTTDSSGVSNRRRAAQDTGDADIFRVLVLAHRYELLHQAEDKFTLMWPGCTISWLKGTRKEYWGQVVVASVGTAVNCIPQLLRCNFNLVIVDEAHHSVANTYKTILKGLGFVKEEQIINPDNSSDNNSSSDGVALETADATGPVSLAAVQENLAYETISSSSYTPSREVVAAAAADVLSSNCNSTGTTHVLSSDEDVTASSSRSSSSFDSSSEDEAPAGPQLMLRAVHNPNSLCVGFTATPYRLREAESRQLYDIFTHVYTKNITDMIRARYLSQVHSRKILTHVNLKNVGTSGGDFIASRLSPVVNSDSRNRLVLAGFLDYCTELDSGSNDDATAAAAASRNASAEHADMFIAAAQALQQQHRTDSSSSTAGDDGVRLDMTGRRAARKAIGFAVDIEHAEALNTAFNNAGVRSAAVHSKLPLDETKMNIENFRTGGLDVLWNCEKLTEGFDEPSIDAVLMARPTKSKGLYTQMLGRGLRRAPGKDNCIVLDFTDKFHKADTVVDLRVLLPEHYKNLDPRPPQEPKADRTSKLDTKGLSGGEMSVLSEAVDPLEFAWKRVGPHWMLSMFSEGCVWLLNIAGMGAKQRDHLGLQMGYAQSVSSYDLPQLSNGPQEPHAGTDHNDDNDDGGADSDSEELAQGAARITGSQDSTQDDHDEDDDYDDCVLHDRYVVLHQPRSSCVDPFEWTNVAPQAKKGMTQADAYGAAIDCLITVVHKQQAQAVRSYQAQRRYGSSSGYKGGFVKADTFKHNAPWRRGPMSPQQLKKLSELGVTVPAGARLTKGAASDMISSALAALATPQQLQHLKATLAVEQYLELPVPLLAEHAASLGAHRE